MKICPECNSYNTTEHPDASDGTFHCFECGEQFGFDNFPDVVLPEDDIVKRVFGHRQPILDSLNMPDGWEFGFWAFKTKLEQKCSIFLSANKGAEIASFMAYHPVLGLRPAIAIRTRKG